MTGRVQGKVALITGGGRGQGRSHALKLAAEGADIVAFDLCHDLKSVAYDLATPDDLKRTVAEVEALDRRALGIQGDVRDLSALTDAVSATIDTFGKLDIVCANAGIAGFVPGLGMEGWAEVAGTNLVGVMNTLHATLPAMTAGGSAIVTGSFAAMIKGGIGGEPAGLAYSYAKRQLIDYVKWVAAARRAFDANAGNWRDDVEFRARCVTQLRDGLVRAQERLRRPFPTAEATRLDATA